MSGRLVAHLDQALGAHWRRGSVWVIPHIRPEEARLTEVEAAYAKLRQNGCDHSDAIARLAVRLGVDKGSVKGILNRAAEAESRLPRTPKKGRR